MHALLDIQRPEEARAVAEKLMHDAPASAYADRAWLLVQRAADSGAAEPAHLAVDDSQSAQE